MSTHRQSLWISLALLALSLGANATLHAAEADPAVQKICDAMLKAIVAQDREAFVEHGTDAVKAGTTKGVMTFLHEKIGERMAEGFELTYLTALNQGGHEIHLWKLTCKEGDDTVVRIAMKDGKVGGFFLQ
jgi:hypothetical protein